jgi:hypothetical protein
MERVEPNRPNLRRDNELPKFKKSKSDIDDPKRNMPYTEIPEPKRIKLLRAMEEPM